VARRIGVGFDYLKVLRDLQYVASSTISLGLEANTGARPCWTVTNLMMWRNVKTRDTFSEPSGWTSCRSYQRQWTTKRTSTVLHGWHREPESGANVTFLCSLQCCPIGTGHRTSDQEDRSHRRPRCCPAAILTLRRPLGPVSQTDYGTCSTRVA
jgi:hypothetical protein